MKKLFKLLVFLFLLSFMLTANTPTLYSAENDKSITILFTHDLHDHFYPFDIQQGGQITSVGGFARLATAIKGERAKDPNLLLVDAGDFSMGSLFQTIFAQEAPQLRILGQLGYVATTFGNHEFDFRPGGLAQSLIAAKNSGDPLPQILSANLSFPTDSDSELNLLKAAMDDYGVKDYSVTTLNDIKIGIFGLTGKDAADDAPMAGVEFSDIVESAKRTADILRNEEQVELILCLSHSGTSVKKATSEDEILAQKVPEIDVIISGHTHTVLEQPIVIGNTVIGSTGEYGQNLGVMKLLQNEKGRWDLDSYNLLPINNKLKEDPEIAKTIEGYKRLVEKEYLSQFNLEYEEVLAYSPFNFTPAAFLGKELREDTLGNLIGDAYLYAIQEAEGENYETVHVAVAPYGTIRGSFVTGNITASDAFNVSSLGIGPDKIPGYPLLTVYLTGKELKTIAEVDASVSPIMNAAQLYVAGLSYTFNPHRLIFNKVTAVKLQNFDGSQGEIDDEKLYRVAAGLFSSQMLSVVGDKSFGLLSIIPKDREGKPITDFEKHIVYNKDGQEVKEWFALAQYLQSFEQKNGIPWVPLYYSETQGRKVVDNDTGIISILGNPNKLALSLYLFIFTLLIAIALTAMLVKKRKKQKAKFNF
ncbi:MAG: bifunctional UDP-sugar hydrolase/5'-nucleotidase [Bacillota bacterium]